MANNNVNNNNRSSGGEEVDERTQLANYHHGSRRVPATSSWHQQQQHDNGKAAQHADTSGIIGDGEASAGGGIRERPPPPPPPERRQDDRQRTKEEWEFAFNITNSIHDMFFFTLPIFLKLEGFMGFIYMILVALVCWYTSHILNECSRDDEHDRFHPTYASLAEEAWEEGGGGTVRSHQIAFLLMMCSLHIFLCGQYLIGAFPNTPLGYHFYVLLLGFFLLPCAFIKTYSNVSCFSLAALMLQVVLGAVVVGYCVTQVGWWHWGILDWNWDHVILSNGVVFGVYSYSPHAYLPFLGANLETSRSQRVLKSSFLLSALFKCFFTSITLLTWGLQTKEYVINNLPSVVKHVIGIVLIAKLLLSYPLPYLALVTLLDDDDYVDTESTSPRQRLSFRAGVTVATVLIACIPNCTFWTLVVCSFTGGHLVFIWPASFHLELKSRALTPFLKAVDYVIIMFGLVFIFKGFIGAFVSCERMPDFQNNTHIGWYVRPRLGFSSSYDGVTITDIVFYESKEYFPKPIG